MNQEPTPIRFEAFSHLADGSIVFHRGDISDLKALNWECEPSYWPSLKEHWASLLPCYMASLGRQETTGNAIHQACDQWFIEYEKRHKSYPSTAELVDACCQISGIDLLPLERLLHIRLLKRILASPAEQYVIDNSSNDLPET